MARIDGREIKDATEAKQKGGFQEGMTNEEPGSLREETKADETSVKSAPDCSRTEGSVPPALPEVSC